MCFSVKAEQVRLAPARRHPTYGLSGPPRTINLQSLDLALQARSLHWPVRPCSAGDRSRAGIVGFLCLGLAYPQDWQHRIRHNVIVQVSVLYKPMILAALCGIDFVVIKCVVPDSASHRPPELRQLSTSTNAMFNAGVYSHSLKADAVFVP